MGSLPILEEFLQGQFDLCVIAMPDGIEMPKLDDDQYNLIPLAYKTAVVVVNKDNRFGRYGWISSVLFLFPRRAITEELERFKYFRLCDKQYSSLNPH